MDKFILEIPNFVPPELCKKIIDKFENCKFKNEGYVNYKYYKSDVSVSKKKYNVETTMHEGSYYWKDTYIELSNYLGEAFKEYMRNLYTIFDYKQEQHPYDQILCYKGSNTDRFCVQRIKKGDKFEWHHDGAKKSDYFVQVIIYLNTLDYDEGGRTEFPNGRSVKPEIGKILFFPCSWTFPHCGTEVKSEYKYICTTLLKIDCDW